MPDRLTLSATNRTVLGKKVKHLRREGVLPANVYGRGVESTAIQLDGRRFPRASAKPVSAACSSLPSTASRNPATSSCAPSIARVAPATPSTSTFTRST